MLASPIPFDRRIPSSVRGDFYRNDLSRESIDFTGLPTILQH